MAKFLLLVAIVALSSCVQASLTFPFTWITNGLIQGRFQPSRAGREIASFEGIPFAKKPVRFQPPVPVDNWKGTLNATYPRTPCPHVYVSTYFFEDEDCLTLNVYRPKFNGPPVTQNPNTAGLLPVMVWFHGGSFVQWSGSFFGPKYLVDEDVILVTANYRLGALGFLSTGDNVIEGNAGLKDQLLALKWVKKNILAFGGNPLSVTIFGESAGSASVNNLMISPAAKGLFQRVIAESGTSLSPWALSVQPKTLATAYANVLACPTTLGQETVDCLKTKTTRELLNGQLAVAATNNLWSPVVDGYSATSILPDTPRNLLKRPFENSVTVPIMMGITSDEGLLYANRLLLSPEATFAIDQYWNLYAPSFLQYRQYFPGDSTEVSTNLRQFYFGTKPVSWATSKNLGDAMTDLFFYMGDKQAALILAKNNPFVFFYHFVYRGNFTFADPTGALQAYGTYGPAHTDELQYLFNSLAQPKIYPDIAAGSADEEFSFQMAKLWADFAKSKLFDLRLGNGPVWKPLPFHSSNGVLNWYVLDKVPTQTNENPDMLKRWAFLQKTFNGTQLDLSN